MKFVFICLLNTCLFQSNAFAATQSVENTAPNWQLETPENRTINYYEASSDNASVILFWATWCPFCRSLMPHLQELADEFQNKGVDFYALNIFEDGDPVAYLKKNNFSFTLLIAADLVAEDYGVKGTPGLFVVNKDKKIIYKRRSGMKDEDVKREIRLILNSLIKDKS